MCLWHECMYATRTSATTFGQGGLLVRALFNHFLWLNIQESIVSYTNKQYIGNATSHGVLGFWGFGVLVVLVALVALVVLVVVLVA